MAYDFYQYIIAWLIALLLTATFVWSFFSVLLLSDNIIRDPSHNRIYITYVGKTSNLNMLKIDNIDIFEKKNTTLDEVTPTPVFSSRNTFSQLITIKVTQHNSNFFNISKNPRLLQKLRPSIKLHTAVPNTPSSNVRKIRDAKPRNENDELDLKNRTKSCPHVQWPPRFKETEDTVVYIGCFSKDEMLDDTAFSSFTLLSDMTALMCGKYCSKSGLNFSTIQGKNCYCLSAVNISSYLRWIDPNLCNLLCGNFTCGGISSPNIFSVYRIGSWPPPLKELTVSQVPNGWFKEKNLTNRVTIFLWANARLAALFRTCRLTRYSSEFTYDVIDLRMKVRTQNDIAKLIKKYAGLKIFVFDGCCAKVR